MTRLLLTALLLAMTLPAHANGERVEDVLQELREHGLSSPDASLARLLEVRDPPGDDAPLKVRRLYWYTVGRVGAAADRPELVEQAVQQFDNMAQQAHCFDCRYQGALVRALDTLRFQDAARAAFLLEQAEKHPLASDPQLRMDTQYARAVIHSIQGDHAKAIEHGVLAGQLAARHGYPADQVRALNLLLVVNIDQGNLDAAEKLAADAYAMADRIGDHYRRAYIRGNTSLIHAARGEHEQRRRALEDALAIARSVQGMNEVEILNLLNLAEYYQDRGEFQRSLTLATEAIELAERGGFVRLQGGALVAKADTQLQLGRLREAEEALHAALTLYERVGDLRVMRPVAMHSLARVFQRTGRHADALTTLREIEQIKAAMAAEADEKAALLTQAQFREERKDHEIARLSLESAKRQAESSVAAARHRLWIALAVSFALGASLLAHVAWSMRRRNRELRASHRSLSDASSRDPLTGVFNRRWGEERLLRLQSARAAAGGALILLDLDHFKQINDRHGHGVGDEVLRETARRLGTLLRPQDAVVRWGGEEFLLLLLPDIEAAALPGVAQRLLRHLADPPFAGDSVTIGVTASLGAVVYPLYPEQEVKRALDLADHALYRSKAGGRHRAVCLLRPDGEGGGTGEPAEIAEVAGQRVRMVHVVGPSAASAASDAAPGIPGAAAGARGR